MSQQPPSPSPQPGNLSFENIFEQLLDMMKYAVDHADQPPKNMPADLEARLSILEKEVQLFCEFNDSMLDAVEGAGFPSVEVENLSKQDQRSIERAKQLIQEAQEKLKIIERQEALARARGKGPEKIPTRKKDPARERKKKFKKFGQDKNWKPM